MLSSFRFTAFVAQSIDARHVILSHGVSLLLHSFSVLLQFHAKPILLHGVLFYYMVFNAVTRPLTPDTLYLTPDTWHLTTDTRYLAVDAWYSIPVAWYVISVTRYITPGTWHLTTVTRYLALMYGFSYRLHGVLFLLQGISLLTHGTSLPTHDTLSLIHGILYRQYVQYLLTSGTTSVTQYLARKTHITYCRFEVSQFRHMLARFQGVPSYFLRTVFHSRCIVSHF